jgi:hypothetical protein
MAPVFFALKDKVSLLGLGWCVLAQEEEEAQSSWQH